MKHPCDAQIERQFGGIYLLMDGEVCVYVGQSSNVPYRINQHIQDREKQFDSYVTYFCDNRKELEKTLITLLQPKYNVQHCAFAETHKERYKSVHCAINEELDRLVHVMKMQVGDPVPARRSDLECAIGQRTYLYRPHLIKIAKKYDAYLGEDKDGLIYDLQMILRFKKEIREDIERAEMGQLGY